jgi:hypothetical protein
MTTTPTLEGLMAMRHHDVLDVHDERIGELVEVYFDKATRVPEWLGVDTDLFGMRRVLAPAVGARVDDRGVYIAWGKELVLDTPEVLDREISQDVEKHLYEHYGLQYSFEGSPTGLPRDVQPRAATAYEERSVGAPNSGTYPAHEVTAWQWPDVPKDDAFPVDEVTPSPRGARTFAPDGEHRSSSASTSTLTGKLDNVAPDDARIWLLGAIASAGASVGASARGWRWPAIALRGIALALLYRGVTLKRHHIADEEERKAAQPSPEPHSMRQRIAAVIGRS